MPGGLLGAGDGGEEDDNKARRGRDDDGEAKSGVYRAPKLSAVRVTTARPPKPCRHGAVSRHVWRLIASRRFPRFALRTPSVTG